jgi:hypothetical protein
MDAMPYHAAGLAATVLPLRSVLPHGNMARYWSGAGQCQAVRRTRAGAAKLARNAA